MQDVIRKLLTFLAHLFCIEGWYSEMPKSLDWILGKPQRRGSAVPGLEQERAFSRVPGRPNAPLKGVSTKLKHNGNTEGESNANSHHQDPHSSVLLLTFFCSLSLFVSDSLTLAPFPPHCCFLVCFPSALLWLSRSATATFKASAVTRCLWVPFEILTYMLSGCRQEWLTGPSQSNTGLGRLAVFCQRQPRRSNKGKKQRRKKHT